VKVLYLPRILTYFRNACSTSFFARLILRQVRHIAGVEAHSRSWNHEIRAAQAGGGSFKSFKTGAKQLQAIDPRSGGLSQPGTVHTL